MVVFQQSQWEIYPVFPSPLLATMLGQQKKQQPWPHLHRFPSTFTAAGEDNWTGGRGINVRVGRSRQVSGQPCTEVCRRWRNEKNRLPEAEKKLPFMTIVKGTTGRGNGNARPVKKTRAGRTTTTIGSGYCCCEGGLSCLLTCPDLKAIFGF